MSGTSTPSLNGSTRFPRIGNATDLEVLRQLQEELLVGPQLVKRTAVDLSGPQLAQVRLYVVVLRNHRG